MTPIPRSALILGLAGLIPFGWSVATQASPALSDWGLHHLGPRFIGPYVGLVYGTIILAFMSGVLWGFASHTTGASATTGYILSVIPALWAFVFVGNGPTSAAIMLALGFAGLLGLDFLFWRYRLAPPWWMQLRLILTAGVLACLCVTAYL
jgi:hypothetical protein